MRDPEAPARSGPPADPGSPGAAPPPAPTRREAARGIAAELGAAGVESPGLEAERLLAHVLGLERHELALSGGVRLSPEEARRLARAAARRLAGEPLQHIEGTVAFRELVLAADPRALLPRPETEGLVELVSVWARRRAGERAGAGGARSGGVYVARRPGAGAGPPLEAALDIGTGSGAIALSLVAEGIAIRAVGTDVSEDALRQAEENRARLAPPLATRIEFRRSPGPVWGAVGREERFDVIVSNPPYVTAAEIRTLPREVRDHEPRASLAGGIAGLDVIWEIAAGAARHLEPDGALFLEIGAGQGPAVRALLEGSGAWRVVAVTRDLAGRERYVRAEPAPR